MRRRRTRTSWLCSTTAGTFGSECSFECHPWQEHCAESAEVFICKKNEQRGKPRVANKTRSGRRRKKQPHLTGATMKTKAAKEIPTPDDTWLWFTQRDKDDKPQSSRPTSIFRSLVFVHDLQDIELFNKQLQDKFSHLVEKCIFRQTCKTFLYENCTTEQNLLDANFMVTASDKCTCPFLNFTLFLCCLLSLRTSVILIKMSFQLNDLRSEQSTLPILFCVHLF